MSLTSTSRIKSILGLAAGVTFHDVALGAAVDYANDHVLRCLGQASLAVATVTEYPSVYGPSQTEILLRRAPVVAIVALTNYAAAVTEAGYRLDTENGLLRMSSASRHFWDESRDGVAVTYTYGYTDATVPARVVRAAEIIAVASFNRAPKSGIKSQTSSGFQTTLEDFEIPPEARSILAYYEDRTV